MQNAFKYPGCFLLLLLFSIKIITPAFSSYSFRNGTAIEHQQEKSAEEKSVEKLTGDLFETAQAGYVREEPGITATNSRFLSSNGLLFLPVQYFAIPTPPPWA